MNWYILVIDKRNFQSSEERNEISYQMIEQKTRTKRKGGLGPFNLMMNKRGAKALGKNQSWVKKISDSEKYREGMLKKEP